MQSTFWLVSLRHANDVLLGGMSSLVTKIIMMILHTAVRDHLPINTGFTFNCVTRQQEPAASHPKPHTHTNKQTQTQYSTLETALCKRKSEYMFWFSQALIQSAVCFVSGLLSPSSPQPTNHISMYFNTATRDPQWMLKPCSYYCPLYQTFLVSYHTVTSGTCFL